MSFTISSTLFFFNKYKHYSNLPKTWLIAKKNTATSIFKNLNGSKEVLSFGCGIGFIETIIADLGTDLFIDAFDFSEISSKWIKNSMKINCINSICDKKKYDMIYLCQVSYAFPEDDCVIVLKNLASKLKKGGQILLIDTSMIPSENGLSKYLNLVYYIKSIFNIIFHFFEYIIKIFFPVMNMKKQFWGWQRVNKKTSEFVTKAGLKLIKQFASDNQSFTLITNNE